MPSDTDSKTASSMAYYEDRAAALLCSYEQVTFEAVHRDLVPLLPSTPGVALDVGAGSGRDSAWLAQNGWHVVAVEPSPALLAGARRLHRARGINWLGDSLPHLKRVRTLGMRFDLILLSAVWMHVPPSEHATAFKAIMSLLANRGLVNITFRMEDTLGGRGFFHTNVGELKRLARHSDLCLASETESGDALGRADVLWQSLIFRRAE